jgi:hypothetical protein
VTGKKNEASIVARLVNLQLIEVPWVTYFFLKRLTQFRCPRAFASSCWLYSIIFDAVYGSISDPLPIASILAASCRSAALRFGVLRCSTSDTHRIGYSALGVTAAWAGFCTVHSVR